MTVPVRSPRVLCLALSIFVSTMGVDTGIAAARPAAEPAEPSEPAGRGVVELDAQANAAYQTGAYDAAAKLFTELYETTDDPNYLYNLSVCYDRLGRLEESLEALDRYAAEAPDHDRDAVAGKRRGLEIRLETERRREEERSEAEATPKEEPPRPAPAPAEPMEDQPRRGRSLPLDVAGGLALGLGVAGIAVGIGLGVTSRRRQDAVEQDCATVGGGFVCSEPQRDDVEKGESFALGADVAIAVGGVLAVSGAALLVVSTVRAKKARDRVAVAPAVGPQMTGLAVAGRF